MSQEFEVRSNPTFGLNVFVESVPSTKGCRRCWFQSFLGEESLLGQYLLFLLGLVIPVVTGLSVGVVGGLLFRAFLASGPPLARWRSGGAR